jgi:hypothetical protein
MENEGRVIILFIGLAATIGFIVGKVVAYSNYERDTYDCTIKCPNNSHSIQFDNVCYCEVK